MLSRQTESTYHGDTENTEILIGAFTELCTNSSCLRVLRVSVVIKPTY